MIAPSPYVLLKYQRSWFSDPSPVKIIEKSRRIGITWASACLAIDRAATDAMSTMYIAYEERQGAQFIKDCAFWARHYQVAFSESTQLIEDVDPQTGASKSIKAFSIDFRNGRSIQAMSSAPRNLRGKAGAICLDEFAFHDQPEELLTAAIALLIWGGKVEIISTHNGIGSYFNTLIKDVKAGALPYSLHSVNLDHALADGLYKRVCYVSGQKWSLEAEAQWRADLMRQYSRNATEELLCIPSAGGIGLFKREWFEIVDSIDRRAIKMEARGWDQAGTKPTAGKSPDFTRGVKGALMPDSSIVITHVASMQDTPAKVRDLIKTCAQQDGIGCQVGLWVDPGNSGIYASDDLIAHLSGYTVKAERAAKDKIFYATPWSSAAENGRIKLLRGAWNEEWLAEAESFPSKAWKDDQVDATSRMFQLLTGTSFAYGYDSQRTIQGSPTSTLDRWGFDSDDDSTTRSCF